MTSKELDQAILDRIERLKPLDPSQADESPDSSEVTETALFPAWKEAEKKFLEANFEPGSIIEHDWFWAALDMEKPKPDWLFSRGEKAKLAYLAQMEPLRKSLLANHCIDLRSKQGVGYEYLHPGDQTTSAVADGMRDLRRALARYGSRLVNVQLDKLTDKQRAENALELTRLQSRRLITDRRRRDAE